MPPDENPPTLSAAHRLHIAACVIERHDGMIALVRKRGTTAFMQPGGKLEPNETGAEAVIREVEEELGILLTVEVTPLGRFSALAANEPDTEVLAEVFWCRCDEDPTVQAEIEELCWIDPYAPPAIELAPLTRDHILPALLKLRSER
jgi:8-oxo-dGTP diphosphatase